MSGPARSMSMDILERAALGPNMYRVTIAVNEKVRQPPELDLDGLSTDNYGRNPVVMWAHDAVGRTASGGLPIGRTQSISHTPDGRIVADFEFLSDDPFARRVKNAWDKGFLQAASISWIPLETAPAEGGGRRDVRSDLLEWSIVSVPADPDASVQMTAGRHSRATQLHRLSVPGEALDDLTTALALLREAIDAIHGSARWPDENGATEAYRDELSELHAMARSVRDKMRARGTT